MMLLQLLLQSPLTDLSNNEDIPVATGHTTAEAMIKDFVFLHGCKHALANSKIYYNKDSYNYIYTNGDGLHTMVIPMKDKVMNYTWQRKQEERKNSS